MYKRILLFCFILLLSMTGCERKYDNIVETEIVVKNTGINNLGVLLNYYRINSSERFALVWENDNLRQYDDKFIPATADNVPTKAVKRIADKLGFKDTFLEINESLLFYEKQEEYDLFLAENRDEKQWKLYFLFEEDFEEVVIQNDEVLNIDDYQVENDCIYLFSKYIYKVNLKDYSTEIILNEQQSFELEGTGELAFILEDLFVSPINIFGEDGDYTGTYRLYNFGTGDVLEKKEKDYINKVFPYKDGFIALCSKNGTWDPCIKYFDEKFELIDEKDIDINSEDGNVVIGFLVHRGYLIENKIYTIMMVDGSYTREIVVVDADTADVLYQVEVSFKDRKGYNLAGPDYYEVKDELINIRKINN